MSSDKTKKEKRLDSIYRRIKKNDCEWSDFTSTSFREWYEREAKEQGNRCFYCGLPGDTEKYYQKHFRPDKDGDCKRGLNLEVDRKNNNKPYSPTNCVLACYPCNNAKSDVFSYDEFVEIGRTIEKIKKRS